MDVIVRSVRTLVEKDSDGYMQVALVLKTPDVRRPNVKYLLITADPTLVDSLRVMKESKEKVDLEALDVLLTAAQWPTEMQ